MRKKLSLWRQTIIKHPYISAGISALVVIILFIFLSYIFSWGWTGFSSEESPIIITSTSKGIYTAKLLQPAKTLWDWINLLGVLAIPVVVTLGAAWYSARHSHEIEIAEAQRDFERDIAEDNQRETVLRVYLDQMSELLLHEHLRGTKANDEVRNIARVRTLVVLPSLDGQRKDDVFQFLYESHLISKDQPIISLNGADLSGINQVGANLSGTNLSRTNLNGANLNGTNMSESDLSGADLIGADLIEVDLSKSNLSNANLTRANLLAAILKEANFDGADLSETDLSHTQLEGVNFSDANLKGAKGITIEELEKQAGSVQGTIMPDGSIHP